MVGGRMTVRNKYVLTLNLGAGFGNPLLDITVNIDNDELLKKYKLNEDDQTELPVDEIKSLYNDICNYPNQLSAGGCVQNTLRVLQWLINIPDATLYFGAIGDDTQGKQLTELVNAAKVTTRYMIHQDKPTGSCIALVKGTSRSLVANLGAAEFYNIDTLNSADNLKILKSVQVTYMEGFFLTNRLEVGMYVRNVCMVNETVLAFNLCGAYLFDMYPDDMVDFAKSSQILFGNKTEYLALGKILSITNLEDIVVMLSKTCAKSGNKLLRYGKIVIVTNGPKSVLCAYNGGQILEFPVPQMGPEKIRDTTGAGDSFVAGFLTGLLRDFELDKCLKLASWTAGQIIQQIGCTIPNFTPDLENIN